MEILRAQMNGLLVINYKAKRYLQSLVTTNVLDLVEFDESNEQDLNNSNKTFANEDYEADDESVYNANTSFKD